MKSVGFTVIFLWMSFASLAASSAPKDIHGWTLIVDITKYNDPEIAITNFKDSLADKLKTVLIDVGGFPENQIVVIKDKQCTFRGLKFALENLSQRIERNDRLILYFRGCVAKPSTVKPACLLAYDTPGNDMSEAISEKLLGQWLSKIKAKDKILIMDYYTFKSDARQYTNLWC